MSFPIIENTVQSFINKNTNVFTAVDGEIPDSQDAIALAYRVALGSVFMLSLGGYVFRSNFNPFHESIESHSYEYASFNADEEYLQFKRKKAETLALKLKVIAQSNADLSIARNLQLIADKAKPLQLFGGSFNQPLNRGKWVITSLMITRSDFVAYGDAVTNDIDVQLKKYHELGATKPKKLMDYANDLLD